MTDPIAIVAELAQIFERHGVRYALSGSMASSMFGEPRSTIDADIAVSVDPATFAEIAKVLTDRGFYVPVDFATESISRGTSFNIISPDSFKIDLFVATDHFLDRRQLDNRIQVSVPGVETPIWVVAPTDQILRKLDWCRRGGAVSERQWRDVVGILAAQWEHLDLDDLMGKAADLGVDDLLKAALDELRAGSG